MNLIGKEVIHNKFGIGTIKEQNDSSIWVEFSKDFGSKKFKYPSCFEMFLRLVDENDIAKMDKYGKNVNCKKEELFEYEILAHITDEREPRSNFTQRRKLNSKMANSTATSELVNQFCEEYKCALNDEISLLKTTGGKRRKVFDGKLIEAKENRYIYSFEADEELYYPDGTQISIWRNQTCIAGAINECEEFTIIISTTVDFGIEVSSIEFTAEPWRLMHALIERLEELRINPSSIAQKIICDGKKCISHNDESIKTGQETAIKMALSQPITFIWGPPGTGKTQTLAKIALDCIKNGKRVLMLSHSNVAVDGAIMRVHELSEDKKPGKAVRYGYTRRKDVAEHEYLTSYNLAIHNHPDLLESRNKLIRNRKDYSRNSTQYVQIGQAIANIRSKLLTEEKASVENAKFVATTISKAIVDRTIYDSSFDVVIFDEASMAYVPQIVCAAELAEENFICVGDFRQLPPIVQSGSESRLNADIFQYCGIQEAVNKGKNHKWLCMLNEQYRMHPEIADFSNNIMYAGLLKSAANMELKRAKTTDAAPSEGNAICFADLSGMMSVCTKTNDNSRVNVLSAFISIALALEAPKNQEVGVITPYHAQSKLLYSMARDVEKVNTEDKRISCATVHQFQGSEKDIIIYDAVDCYRMTHPGVLLNSTENNYANRLFNVAITRAKGKFIGVANIAYMKNKKLSTNLMFEKLIEMQKEKESCMQGDTLLQKQDNQIENVMSFFSEYDGSRKCILDMAIAKKEIRMDIPDKLCDNEIIPKFVDALVDAKTRGLVVYVRAENKNRLPEAVKKIAIENKLAVNPIILIDRKVTWFGLPSSAANFISKNKEIETSYRPVIRFVGENTARSIFGFQEMTKTIDQSKISDMDEKDNFRADNFANYVLNEKTCSKCGKAMKLRKNRKGGFFLGCTGYPSCKENAFVDLKLVEKYLQQGGENGQLCPRCHYSLEAKRGAYGVYIQCCGLERHKYKLDEI